MNDELVLRIGSFLLGAIFIEGLWAFKQQKPWILTVLVVLALIILIIGVYLSEKYATRQ